jgi:hypothetical protein
VFAAITTELLVPVSTAPNEFLVVNAEEYTPAVDVLVKPVIWMDTAVPDVTAAGTVSV